MRVLLIGATGAIGTRIVPQLVARGHEVLGSTRSAARAERVRALGAQPVLLDILDPAAVGRTVAELRPDAIIHQATALSQGKLSRKLDRAFAQTNRLRTLGTDHLLAAARAAGVRRFVAQSFAPYRYAPVGGPVKTEQDPLNTDPPAGVRQGFAAMAHVETAVTAAGGVALRYGGFYGDPADSTARQVRKRRMPIVGDGSGLMSLIHLEDAASATVLALEHDGPALFNVVDDDPAPMSEWLPALAEALGAAPPRRVPYRLARLLAGPSLDMMVHARGASNAKARAELGWVPRYPSWREGFRAAYGRE